MTSNIRTAIDLMNAEAVNLMTQQVAYAADKDTALAFVTRDLVGYYMRLGYSRVPFDEVEAIDSDQRMPRELPYGMFAPTELDGFAISENSTGVPMFLMAGKAEHINSLRDRRTQLKSGVLRPGALTRQEIVNSRRVDSNNQYTGLYEDKEAAVTERLSL